jgi:putative DNA primase/helicase
MTTYEIAARLNAKPSGKGRWNARCPAHDDNRPSLSIAEGKEGRTLLKCQAQCSTEAVVAACGLTLADLFDKQAESRAPVNGKSRIVAEYAYTDENGETLYVVERREPKSFVQKVPDGKGGWRYKLDGVRRVPYRLPELRDAIARGETIYVVEGEKDADALTKLGLCATTSAQGAAWEWPASWTEFFRGGKRVRFLPDCDAPGRKAALQRASIIATVCADVRVLDLAPERSDGYDGSDWLGERHSGDEMVALADAGPRIEAQAPSDALEGDDGVGELVTICAADVHARRPSWFAKDRIPFGAVTLFDGAGDIGKTTTLMGVIAAASVGISFFDGESIERVTTLIVVEEDSLGLLKMRLKAGGADLTRVHFITGVCIEGATEPFTLPRHVEELERKIQETGARLVYVDALFSHLELDGEGRMPQQARRALRPIVEMVGRINVAFTAVRHWTKANGPASIRALGSGEFGNVARSVLSFGRHPEAEDRYVIAVTKHNLSRLAPTLAYRIEIVTSTDDDGETCETTKVELDGEASDVTADDLAMRLPGDPDERNVAQEWLADHLCDGEWHDSAEVYKAARKDGAGAPATIRRAAARLGVERDRSGFPSRSRWRLCADRSQIAHSQRVSELESTVERTEQSAPDETLARVDGKAFRHESGAVIGNGRDSLERYANSLGLTQADGWRGNAPPGPAQTEFGL